MEQQLHSLYLPHPLFLPHYRSTNGSTPLFLSLFPSPSSYRQTQIRRNLTASKPVGNTTTYRFNSSGNPGGLFQLKALFLAFGSDSTDALTNRASGIRFDELNGFVGVKASSIRNLGLKWLTSRRASYDDSIEDESEEQSMNLLDWRWV